MNAQRLVKAAICGAIVAILAACSCDAPHATVTLRGSDTLVALVQRWAALYMREHPGVALQVSGGGTGTGLAALRNGTADIATASRRLTREERDAIARDRGARVHEHPVAIDVVEIYVHPRNPIASLDLATLSAIFRGELTSWRQLGGEDRPIVLYGRENSSGTYAYFKERVLEGADFALEAQSLPGTAAVVHAVSRDPGGIGYGGIAHHRGVRVVPLQADQAELLHRTLYFYTVGESSVDVSELLALVTSRRGQSVAERAGFLPLREVPL